jgi:hypothetical protein
MITKSANEPAKNIQGRFNEIVLSHLKSLVDSDLSEGPSLDESKRKLTIKIDRYLIVPD